MNLLVRTANNLSRVTSSPIHRINKHNLVRLFSAAEASAKFSRPTADEKLSKHQQEWENAKPYESMPGLTKLGMTRAFLPGGIFYKADFGQLLEIGHSTFGNIYRMPALLGNPETVVTFTPDDFEKVFRVEGPWPNRRELNTLKHFRMEKHADFYKDAGGLLVTGGEDWAKFRSTVNPVLMNPNSIKLYLSKMLNVNTEFLERIREIRDPHTLEVPATFEDEINRWTFESVVVVALDSELGLIRSNRDNPEAKLLFDSLNVFFENVVELDIKPSIWRYVRTPKYTELMKALENIHNTTEKFVNEAMDRIESKGSSSDGEKSVFERIARTNKKVAIVMAMDMLLAGVDTTTSQFAAIMLCLAKNPDKQEKLREEVRRVLPEKDSLFTVESMKNLPYLRGCIKEGMRMYALNTGNLRTASQDVVLSGYRIPKGTDVAMGQEYLFKHPKYFPQPDKYLPERWLRDTDSNLSVKSSHPFAFLPFGFGPRMCVGKRIVDLELEVGIARIIRNFNVEFNYPAETVFQRLLIQTPAAPLKFKFSDVEK